MPRDRYIRCVRTIQPHRGERVLTAELCQQANARLSDGQHIVVELGWRDFETGAASVLAWYVVEGHPVEIRGKRHENQLRQLMLTFAEQIEQDAAIPS
ncbi:MAG TPA: hypothetical protein VHC43_09870 [Mycobacteriales bacterium]|nr:hypothetical protein [Mycobacteriales bacterium]